MARIGIMTCSNTTGELCCSSSMCLEDIRLRRGHFADYPGDQPLDLVGLISCAGCPTVAAPGKLANRLRNLTVLGVDAIHMANCMMALCPFLKKYVSLIRQTCPDVEVVIGTHGEPEGVTLELFRDGAAGMLCAPKPTIADMIEQARAACGE